MNGSDTFQSFLVCSLQIIVHDDGKIFRVDWDHKNPYCVGRIVEGFFGLERSPTGKNPMFRMVKNETAVIPTAWRKYSL